MEWTTVKPDQTCIFVAADLVNNQWEHGLWEIKEVNWGDGPYLAILDDLGEEWGSLQEFSADKYLILPKH